MTQKLLAKIAPAFIAGVFTFVPTTVSLTTGLPIAQIASAADRGGDHDRGDRDRGNRDRHDNDRGNKGDRHDHDRGHDKADW